MDVTTLLRSVPINWVLSDVVGFVPLSRVINLLIIPVNVLHLTFKLWLPFPPEFAQLCHASLVPVRVPRDLVTLNPYFQLAKTELYISPSVSSLARMAESPLLSLVVVVLLFPIMVALKITGCERGVLFDF